LSEAERVINGSEPKPLSPEEEFAFKLLSRSKKIITPENTQKFAASTYLSVLLAHLKNNVREIHRRISMLEE
jgi:hypothetical protein